MSAFPWDLVKAENLRAICRDLGLYASHKRDDMIQLFRVAHERGVDAVLEEDKSIRTAAASSRGPANIKRESAPRPKRSRRSDPGPGMMVTRNRGARTKSYRANPVRPKRRGPVKKYGAPATAHAQTFDGVVLSSRRPSSGSRKRKRQESPEELEIGDGDDADGETDTGIGQEDQTIGSEPQLQNGSGNGGPDDTVEDQTEGIEESEPSFPQANGSEKENEIPLENATAGEENEMAVCLEDKVSENGGVVGDPDEPAALGEGSNDVAEGRSYNGLEPEAQNEDEITEDDLVEDLPPAISGVASNYNAGGKDVDLGLVAVAAVETTSTVMGLTQQNTSH